MKRETTGPRVVIIGAPGSGKTRVGKRVARILGVPFVDTDHRIIDAHGPIPTIFDTVGEPRFRELEREAVRQALTEDAVVSLGGGAVLNGDTRAELQSLPVVLLTVSSEAVASRISNGRRPLLRGGIESWITLVENRRELYESLAGATWDTSTRPIDHIAEEISEWLRKKAS